MIEVKLTQEQCEMAIKMADEKVDRILEKGLKNSITEVMETAATIKESQRTSYLHDKALEQCQINVFLKLLKVQEAIADICTLEKHYIKEVPEKSKEEISDMHDAYADLNNDYVVYALTQLALDILDDDEIDEILDCDV